MSKSKNSRHNNTFSDYDDDYYDPKREKKFKDKRKNKVIQRALKTLDVDTLMDLDEDEDY